MQISQVTYVLTPYHLKGLSPCTVVADTSFYVTYTYYPLKYKYTDLLGKTS